MQNLDQFYKCSLFDKQIDNLNNFSFVQKELLFRETKNNQQLFDSVEVEYKCSSQVRVFDNNKPSIIIPSRNMIDLVRYTLNNLHTNSVHEICNIFLVDDRSTDDYKSLLSEFPFLNYIRVDNKKGFNFSNLCNIAAYLVHKKAGKEIILWNNDLWVEKKEYLETIIRKHREDGSTISGTKLLYPLKSFNGKIEDSENIKQYFPNMKDGKWRGTVQFGGSAWINISNNILNYSPIHYKRFSEKHLPLVNCNKGETFVTGAFQLIELAWFLRCGGLNPSLSKNFQDVDLCLKANKTGDTVMYYGKDIFFWHDESLTFHAANEKKNDKQFLSDYIIFAKIWNETMASIIL
jgi:GT2 family glycosyltransferase